MEIHEIKAQLTLKEVLGHYNLKPDKQNRLNCPFHDDKTPSLQVYYKTQTCYCFSSNCPTHGKSMDVIDFIMHKEQISKHEAILKARELISGSGTATVKQELTRTAVLLKMFIYFKNAIHNSKPAKEYIEGRNLDHTQLEIGYNSGQFHHGTRKDQYLIESCIKVGLLIPSGTNSRTGGQAYKPFGKGGIVFPLKNKQNQVISLYFRSTTDNHKSRHFYLKDRQGLYPRYPKPTTTKLILTEAIIDSATLLLQPEITKGFEVLSLYGTNGLTEEHLEAIKGLKDLEEIAFWFDGDQAGRSAADKYSKELHQLKPGIKISQVETPEGEDINSLLDGHQPEILTNLLSNRQPLKAQESNLIFSTEKETNEKPVEKEKPKLDTTNPNNIKYSGAAADYYIKGGPKGSLDSLKVSLQIVSKENRHDYRGKADLYEYKQTAAVSQKAAKLLGLEESQIQNDLNQLTRLLETYREKQQSQKQNPYDRQQVTVPQAAVSQCMEILKAKNPIQSINQIIEKAGVTGEENNRIFLLAIASSYKMPDTLHALIQGSSGSGKTRLLKTICELMPAEDTLKFTRVTDSSFYNQDEYFFVNKLVCFEDLDGLKEDAQLAVRELQSNEILTTSTSIKDKNGSITGGERIVRGPIASLSCTTKGETYEDNISRSFLIAVDESREQTLRVIDYQNKRASGSISKEDEKRVQRFVQNCIRMLKPYEVINPYATKIKLPEEAHKIRRLNELYQSFVRQITLLNQYQRKKDKQGRLITAKEDLQTACDILFESIVLKVDELDGSLRQFFEKLKDYVNNRQSETDDFTQREIRQAFNISKAQCSRNFSRLQSMEYITSRYSNNQRKVSYKIDYWDNYAKLRAKIKDDLTNQINEI